MFGRKYWIGLTVFLMAIVGISLYYLQTRPPKDPIVIYKPVEPLPKSEVKAPEGDTSQGGHFHSDGTWHEGPHDPVVETPPCSGASSQRCRVGGDPRGHAEARHPTAHRSEERGL